MVIDTHAHIFSEMHGRIGRGPTRSLKYGQVQVGDEPPMRLLPPLSAETAFPPEVLLEFMDWGGVDRTVLLQGSFYGESNEYLAKAVRQWPDRFTAAAYIDPRADDARETFLKAVEDLGFYILKFEMTGGTGLTSLYPDLRLDDDFMGWTWEEAERRKLTITLDLGAPGTPSYQTDLVRKMIERHPTLKVVIAHLAQPPIANPDDERLKALWRDQLSLGKHPNVCFDLSALPAYFQEDGFPFEIPQRFVREARELVGAENMMWGTDVPGLLGVAMYRQLREWIERHCDFFEPDELPGVMGETAQRVYVDSAL